MLDLTFGEQVKLILSRRGMTIKELAETIEKRTGKKMSRQNLTQRLGRDNFQEQDMRMIAEILGCPFQLSILEEDGQTTPTEEKLHKEAPVTTAAEEPMPEEAEEAVAEEPVAEEAEEAVTEEPVAEEAEEAVAEEPMPEEAEEAAEEPATAERDITIGELVDIHEELDAMEEEKAQAEKASREEKKHGWRSFFKKIRKGEEAQHAEQPAAEETGDRTAEVEDAAEPEADSTLVRMPEAMAESAAEAYAPEEEPEYYEGYGYGEEEVGIPEEEMEEVPEDPYAEFRMSNEEDLEKGDINPYTGREYKSNSVRMHPTRIGYVQVYDRGKHTWTDMTEWAFLGYQERKKAIMGKDYDPPVYLD
ncbi:hypothetical protein [uncultured Merdimonas sp.]|uniref:hypothetical protein n=1 Tax=uncultured Merdimonas sp. TaxID=2023269 RepID=UPI003209CAEC